MWRYILPILTFSLHVVASLANLNLFPQAEKLNIFNSSSQISDLARDRLNWKNQRFPLSVATNWWWLIRILIKIATICLIYYSVSPDSLPFSPFCASRMVNTENEGTQTEKSIHQFPEEARRILLNIASEWGDVAACDSPEVVQLKGAMTNEVYQINWPAVGSSRRVIVRIYGEGVDVFFDREMEVRTFECMSKHGQGPRLLGRFANGRVEEFINARTLSAADLRDPEISSLIAIKLQEFHNLHMPGPRDVLLWPRLRGWTKKALDLCSAEEAKEFSLDNIGEEINMLETALSQDGERIGFCHNDLQYGNIMIDEETRQVTIIDYEYASFNPIAFDIANHFCEMSANYHTDKPHVLDFSQYPGVEERRRFVKTYLSSSGETPSDVEIENLLKEIEKYALGGHLFWGLWGIISEHVNDIDFDYKEYARQRFQQYWLMKPVLQRS